jgi:hydroxypyruvate isomerase
MPDATPASSTEVGPRPPLRFAANLSWLYTDLPFLDRFEAAARDGFRGVECLFPHEHPTAEVAARLRDLGLELVLFNARPGDWAAGERGLAGVPGREAAFRDSVREALSRAEALACPRVHAMAGLLGPAAEPAARTLAWRTYEANLRWAAEQARAADRVLTIEPINPRDMPGYLLTRSGEALALLENIDADHLQLQLDLYHAQIVEGDLTMRLRQALPTGRVGHLQIAAVPDRGEPDAGELNFPWVFEQLRQLAWTGWIGCEYRPRAAPRPDAPGQATSAGLGWLRQASP